MGKKKTAVAILCAVAFIADINSSAHSDVIVTGANLSSEARAKIERIKPDSTFETQALPLQPNYSSVDAWAALPDNVDNADFAPANTKYPESQTNAPADVFFIHPTTAVTAVNNWNIPIDDAAAVKDLDTILFCASVFNAAAKVYAPRYREAAFYAFFDDKTDSGIKAIDLAYHDVEQAFLYYIKHYNRGRPFILAGHSQGSIHGFRLLQEHIIGTTLMDRMIASYLIGGTIPEKIQGISPSRSATDTGVLIGWNTYTKDGDPSIFTDGLIGWIDGSYTKMGGRPLLQINPISWELKGPEVLPSQNPGSLPTPQTAAKMPLLLLAVCGADASGKILIINKPAVGGFAFPELGDMPVLNDRYGDYHDFDYQLFYESIRKNVVDRVKAFFSDNLPSMTTRALDGRYANT
ncbi:MAG: DUF3089 domain-containing protein [Candidatus Omnitrophica bacterium]|nr:DUF3089 domain-containing protein [Candidatus Omnitrophota bacterium]